MFKINKNVSWSILLCLAVAISCWFSFQQARQQKFKQTRTKLTGPDSIMENVIASRMNQQGQLTTELYSPKMDYYAAENMTNIAEPHIILYSENKEPWHITSVYGRAHKGTSWVDLWENVKGHQNAHADQPAITFLTTEITVYPKQKYAFTDQPVKTIRASTVMDGVGMHADLQKNTIELLSQVQTHYVPTP